MIQKVFGIFCVSAFAFVLIMNMQGVTTFGTEINFSELSLDFVNTFVGFKDGLVSVIEWVQGLFSAFIGN